ncbi:MAG: Na+/H+ antiporter NhaC family protein [Sulfolobales archaeon]|nr:Na+/H+ antiporter NhaC family protein [Sulfolobales archaeon]MDW8082610.1 Na+/H+ antiporter NhaC family protein [Sulfolobales archaeon]
MNAKFSINIAIVILVLIIALALVAPPNAEYMPEDKRFPYYTFPLLPPLLAITLCMLTGQVLPSLFLGVWVGALMVSAYNPLAGTTLTLNWLVENATDSWNATILLFDFVIGALVGLLYVSGSLHSLAESLAKKVRTARGASLATTALGTIVFFDDYTNTIIVGNTMRPLTDRLRVSRELLSYIVDSTAAPVAGIALVSTWIGYEVGQIRAALETLQEEVAAGKLAVAPEVGPYAMWLSALPYHFYSILALLMVYLVIISRKHFGPMLAAETRSIAEGKVIRDGAVPLMPTETILGEPVREKRAPPALFITSIATLVAITLLGMWYTGAQVIIESYAEEGLVYEAPWWTIPFSEALMDSDAATALFWGSFAGYIVALAGVLVLKVLSFTKAMEYTVKGMYTMLYANAILLHAWSIKTATDTVGTADYVINNAVAVGVPAHAAPLIIFLVSMFVSYTTGTSWGTFGIMMPIAVPLAWKLAIIQYGDQGLAFALAAASVGAVFGGGIYGDHVSPISDTTIMSSMFSSCDHIDHVKTQLPYGTIAAVVSIVLYILILIGVLNPLILLPLGVVILLLLYLSITRKTKPIPNYKAS